MTRKERNLFNSHAAMLKFLEALIVNSDKFYTKSKRAQKHYNMAVKLTAKARTASAILLQQRQSEG